MSHKKFLYHNKMDENKDEPKLTSQQRYRSSDKCKAARQRYYESKGREKAREYYLLNKEKILERSKQRYEDAKNNDLKIDLM
jgi:hypothetical protein